ncbi:MAG: ParB N-terminal domain-containing protein [Roseobacter sp.]|jgi:ParB family chromosome partitioning protein|nr:ParB N-terminal domain-containing protein [Roseobacter sp.]
MAKRRRLAPANPESALQDPVLRSHGEGRTEIRRRATVPIADVAGEAAEQAAFEEVAGALQSAREEGRLIQRLPLDEIRQDHLLRDRLILDEEEMAALMASLSARGQQTPVEAVALPDGGYGLISGLRRVEALRRLGETAVLALIRAPEGSEAAYVAMVEENEIRANLSFYERARVAAEAARIRVYPSPQAAVQALFAHASPSKRSKILNFVTLHEALAGSLRFPAAIPEKLGLALAKAMNDAPDFAARLRDSLRKTPAADAGAERIALERALARVGRRTKTPAPRAAARGEEIAADLFFEVGQGQVVLQGPRLDPDLVADLRQWLIDRTARNSSK